MGSSQLALYLLGSLQKLARRKGAFHTDCSIKKLVGRRESPRFCFIKSRLTHNVPNLLFYLFYSIFYQLPAISKVASQT